MMDGQHTDQYGQPTDLAVLVSAEGRQLVGDEPGNEDSSLHQSPLVNVPDDRTTTAIDAGVTAPLGAPTQRPEDGTAVPEVDTPSGRVVGARGRTTGSSCGTKEADFSDDDHQPVSQSEHSTQPSPPEQQLPLYPLPTAEPGRGGHGQAEGQVLAVDTSTSGGAIGYSYSTSSSLSPMAMTGRAISPSATYPGRQVSLSSLSPQDGSRAKLVDLPSLKQVDLASSASANRVRYEHPLVPRLPLPEFPPPETSLSASQLASNQPQPKDRPVSKAGPAVSTLTDNDAKQLEAMLLESLASAAQPQQLQRQQQQREEGGQGAAGGGGGEEEKTYRRSILTGGAKLPSITSPSSSSCNKDNPPSETTAANSSNVAPPLATKDACLSVQTTVSSPSVISRLFSTSATLPSTATAAPPPSGDPRASTGELVHFDATATDTASSAARGGLFASLRSSKRTPKSRRKSALPQLVKEGDIKELAERIETYPNRLEEKDVDRRTALIVAAEVGNIKAVRLLLEAGADVHAKDRRQADPLFAASSRGFKEVVEVLLETGGANVNNRGLSGRTALHDATANGHLPVVVTLLEHGADPNVVDMKGVSPLMVGASEGRFEVCHTLIKHGANVGAADFDGLTALIIAAFEGHQYIVQLLVNNSANVSAVNVNGHTALHLAYAAGHVEIGEILIRAGAQKKAKDRKGLKPSDLLPAQSKTLASQLLGGPAVGDNAARRKAGLEAYNRRRSV